MWPFGKSLAEVNTSHTGPQTQDPPSEAASLSTKPSGEHPRSSQFAGWSRERQNIQREPKVPIPPKCFQEAKGSPRARTIHLGEQLVEGLLALLVALGHGGRSLGPQRVDLVHEYQTRRIHARALEQVTHLTVPSRPKRVGSCQSEHQNQECLSSIHVVPGSSADPRRQQHGHPRVRAHKEILTVLHLTAQARAPDFLPFVRINEN